MKIFSILKKICNAPLNLYRFIGVSCFLSFYNYATAAGGTDWTKKPCTFLNSILDGIKILGFAIGAILFIVAGYQVISGLKRPVDCWTWFVGAIAIGAAEPIVEIFMGDLGKCNI